MRIAIVGSGISGMVAGYHLHQQHKITIFEANDYVGGHTNTVSIQLDDEHHEIDTGFIVFNDRTYPEFCRLLDELGVQSIPTSMSFSVRSDRDRLEYNGSNLRGLFAQKRNLIRPGFYRMIADILRFNREAPDVLSQADESTTVGEYVADGGYSKEFVEHYLLPMGAAIWSCPTTTFEEFPVRFIVDFYVNHGLLSLRNRPTWRVIRGGSAKYVEALTDGFTDKIRLNSPVTKVTRRSDGVDICTERGFETFDEVIFACHSDQALRILGDNVTPVEREILSQIPYEPNTATLHTDESVLPRRRTAWACWNYHIPRDEYQSATLTYNMSMLQHIRSDKTFCVSLNDRGTIDPDKVLAEFQYSHPVFTVNRRTAQARHTEVIRNNRTSFCGAYWGNGFHEDGVNSALAVVDAFKGKDQQSSQMDSSSEMIRA